MDIELQENMIITYEEYQKLNYRNDIEELESGSLPKSWDEFIKVRVTFCNGNIVNIRVNNPSY